MSLHIGAQPGQVASSVLLPGDPLRAKWIAESYLTDVDQYTAVRGMLGFTGRYRDQRISVQGSGMGQPSLAIYVQELFADYGVDTIVRVGSCGSLTSDLSVRSVIAAASASTDSAMNHWRFRGISYAPTADFTLLRTAYEVASARGLDLRVGQIAAWDSFYSDDPSLLMQLADYGVLAVEMETAALYTLAARFRGRALTIATVSDNLVTEDTTTAEERERTFADAAELALETVVTTSARKR